MPLGSLARCMYCFSRDREDNVVLYECPTCQRIICNGCEHVHNGDYCNDCGFNTANHEPVSECRADGVDICDYHRNEFHYDCPQNDTVMPHIAGMGREATLDYMYDEYIPHALATGQRAAAVELELEYLGENTIGPRVVFAPYLGIDRDGSLNNGIEVTTPPARGEKLVKVVESACNRLFEAGFRPDRTCGMHTHINLSDKVEDKRFLSHLFNAFFAFEDVLYAMQTQKRHNSEYTIPLRKKYKFFDMYGQSSGDFDYTFYGYSKSLETKRYLDGEKSRKYAGPRYAAFNFHSVYYRGSLECRINGGEVDSRRALLWIDLLQTMIARVEQGHSYAFMSKWAAEPVTEKKVKAMRRYFGLSDVLYRYVVERIREGQGFGWTIPAAIEWGVPKKGRPTGEPRPPRRRRGIHVGRRVIHNECARSFVMEAYATRCPICFYNLYDDFGNANYRLSRRAPMPRNPVLTGSDQVVEWANSASLEYVFRINTPPIDI